MLYVFLKISHARLASDVWACVINSIVCSATQVFSLFQIAYSMTSLALVAPVFLDSQRGSSQSSPLSTWLPRSSRFPHRRRGLHLLESGTSLMQDALLKLLPLMNLALEQEKLCKYWNILILISQPCLVVLVEMDTFPPVAGIRSLCLLLKEWGGWWKAHSCWAHVDRFLPNLRGLCECLWRWRGTPWPSSSTLSSWHLHVRCLGLAMPSLAVMKSVNVVETESQWQVYILWLYKC